MAYIGRTQVNSIGRGVSSNRVPNKGVAGKNRNHALTIILSRFGTKSIIHQNIFTDMFAGKASEISVYFAISN